MFHNAILWCSNWNGESCFPFFLACIHIGGGGVGGERELYQILEEMKGHVN